MSKLVHVTRSIVQPQRAHRLMLLLVPLVVLALATPALAHHAFGGVLPQNAFQGFVSGLAHPIIGLDHFAFVVAVGLFAATQAAGFSLPIVFLLAALAGTGCHVLGWMLPVPEVVIALSVIGIGGLLALPQQSQRWFWLGLAAIAGLFHGYAYGESIVGADMNPLVAYLAGFTAIQLAISAIAYRIGATLFQRASGSWPLALRYIGFAVVGAGLVFLSAALFS